MFYLTLILILIVANHAESCSLKCVEGFCHSDENKSRCLCKYGFFGDLCEQIDPCVPSPCVAGSCFQYFEGSKAKYYCNCFYGFSGINCTVGALDPCFVNPCLNNGICRISSLNSAQVQCTCPSDFTGKYCEEKINPCYSNTCQNGGTCIANGIEYKCECESGFNGTNCEQELNECNSNPCQGQKSQCFNLIDGYVCACGPQLTGSNCDVSFNLCDSNPCTLPNTVCKLTNDGESYTCPCLNGFFGPECLPDPCVVKPCKNQGTDACISIYGINPSYICLCENSSYASPYC